MTYLGRREDVLDGLRDLWSDSIALNEGHGVFALSVALAHGRSIDCRHPCIHQALFVP